TKFTNRLEDDLAGGASLKEAAEGLKLKVHTLGAFNKDGNAPDGSKAELPALDKFLDTAFKTDAKTQSSLVASKGGTYYMRRVDSATREHVRPLEEGRDKVTAGWQKQERVKQLGDLAQKIAADFHDPAKRDAAIGKYSLQPTAITVKRDSQKVAGFSL